MTTAGPGLQLSATGGLSGNIPVQAYSFSQGQELAEFTNGRARVTTRFAGKKTAELTVTLFDMTTYTVLKVGTIVTGLTLTISACQDSEGVEAGPGLTITMPNAVITAISELSHDNENDTPATYTVTFSLNRPVGAAADPEATVS